MKYKICIIYKILLLFILFLPIVLTACRQVPVAEIDITTEEPNIKESFAVIRDIDTVNGKISFKGILYDEELELGYHGGVDIKDQYGEILALSQMQLGMIVNLTYNTDNKKLVSMHVSSDENVWQMKNIDNMQINIVDNRAIIYDAAYNITNRTTAFSDDTEIGLNEICVEDQVTVWGYNNEICSVHVDLGHGYVKLKDYATYVGGMIEIGYQVIVPVTENMLLTVREGAYDLRITKGEDTGVKGIVVERNQEAEISLADLQIDPKPTGDVFFQVTPSSASIYIDGKLVNSEGAVTLTYGKHSIMIGADGYYVYEAWFDVEEPYKIKRYVLESVDGSSEETASKNTEAGTTQEPTTESKTTEATTQSTENTDDKKEDGTDQDTTKGKTTNNKVTINGPIGAKLYLDGEYIGIVPASFTKVTGNHIITFSQTGYLSKSYTLTLQDNGKDDTFTYDPLVSLMSLIE